MIENEEAWFRYFDQVVDKVDLSRIRRIAENVCGALGFKLSDKWETYVSDLPKHPITSIYLSSLELRGAGDVVHLEGVKTRILNAIYYRVMDNITTISGIRKDHVTPTKNYRKWNRQGITALRQEKSIAGILIFSPMRLTINFAFE